MQPSPPVALRHALPRYAFLAANYKPRRPDGSSLSLEAFLLEMGETHTFATDDGLLFAPDFHGSMETLVISSKLFVQVRPPLSP